MRPAVSRSGRAKKKWRSIRKYSCSGPAVDATNAPSVLPNSFSTRWACPLRACIERKQRRLLVERFAGPGDERRRNAERRAVRVFENVGRAGDVPDRVAAGFERGADAAGREARSVGLALDQLLAGELGHRAAVAVGREEAVVLFGREAGEREEDVGVVGGALFDRPILHGRGDDVGRPTTFRQAVTNDVNLCLDELLNNTISYGYDDPQPHSIVVNLSLTGGLLAAEVQDDGKPFDLRRPLRRRPAGPYNRERSAASAFISSRH